MFILGRIRTESIGDPVPPPTPPKLPPLPYKTDTGESLLHKPHRPDDILVRVPKKRTAGPPAKEELEQLKEKIKGKKKK